VGRGVGNRLDRDRERVMDVVYIIVLNTDGCIFDLTGFLEGVLLAGNRRLGMVLRMFNADEGKIFFRPGIYKWKNLDICRSFLDTGTSRSSDTCRIIPFDYEYFVGSLNITLFHSMPVFDLS
jgi:hypothetical protein